MSKWALGGHGAVYPGWFDQFQEMGKDEEFGLGLSQNGYLLLLISYQLLQQGHNSIPADHSPFQVTRGTGSWLWVLAGAAAAGNRSCCCIFYVT